MWEVMARDAFVESLGDPSLRIRVLERDPTTLEEALKIVSRLEALGAGDLEENWSDLGRRKKFVKTSAADDYAERQELVSMVEDLRSEVEHNRKELERLGSGEARRRGSEYVAGASGDQTTLIEPVRPAQYSDSPYGGSPIGYWQTPAPTPPSVPQPGASMMSAPGVFPVRYNSGPGEVPVNMTTRKQLVCEYADIFSHDFDLGHCDIFPHRIDTGNAHPFKEQLRRHPIAHLDFIDQQMELA